MNPPAVCTQRKLKGVSSLQCLSQCLNTVCLFVIKQKITSFLFFMYFDYCVLCAWGVLTSCFTSLLYTYCITHCWPDIVYEVRTGWEEWINTGCFHCCVVSPLYLWTHLTYYSDSRSSCSKLRRLCCNQLLDPKLQSHRDFRMKSFNLSRKSEVKSLWTWPPTQEQKLNDRRVNSKAFKTNKPNSETDLFLCSDRQEADLNLVEKTSSVILQSLTLASPWYPWYPQGPPRYEFITHRH